MIHDLLKNVTTPKAITDLIGENSIYPIFKYVLNYKLSLKLKFWFLNHHYLLNVINKTSSKIIVTIKSFRVSHTQKSKNSTTISLVLALFAKRKS